MEPIRIALVGVGKIVRDQHAPVLAASGDFTLVATASPNSTLPGIPAFRTLGDLLRQGPAVDAIGITGVVGVRHAIAREALAAGKAVLLEKPPCPTLSALEDLRAAAATAQRTLFASWHSRFAAQVEPARAWLAAHAPLEVAVHWREDVRRWHPGQAWVWEPGGLGVFDPGVNALSILTAIMPSDLFLTRARLSFPANRQAPIAASLELADAMGLAGSADFDWRETGAQCWEIRVRTDGGTLRLFDGGARLEIDGQAATAPGGGTEHPEYTGLYARFAALIRSGHSQVDERPLRLAADAFLLGERVTVEPFED